MTALPPDQPLSPEGERGPRHASRRAIRSALFGCFLGWPILFYLGFCYWKTIGPLAQTAFVAGSVIWLFTCYDIYESLFLSAAKRSPVAQRVRKVLDFILGVLTLFLLTSPDTFEPQKVTTTVQGGGRPPSFKRRAAVLSSILLLTGWYLGWPVIGYIFDPGSSDNVLSSLFVAGWVLWGLCSLVVSAFVLIYLPMRWPVPFGISILLYLLIVVYLALAHHAVQHP